MTIVKVMTDLSVIGVSFLLLMEHQFPAHLKRVNWYMSLNANALIELIKLKRYQSDDSGTT